MATKRLARVLVEDEELVARLSRSNLLSCKVRARGLVHPRSSDSCASECV